MTDAERKQREQQRKKHPLAEVIQAQYKHAAKWKPKDNILVG